ncbi:MAG: hypothetical protein ABFC78_10510 [Methanoregula sp.]
MHSHTHGGRRRSPEIPWLLVATVAGIVVVVIAALFFFSGFLGSSGGSAGQTSPGAAVTTYATSAAAVSTTSASPSSVAIATATPVTIPATGVYVKVDYLGGFSGTYTVNGVTTKKTNSGTRLYELVDATGTVTAAFQKKDSTTTHALTVSIYRNGVQLNSGSTSAAYGNVTVTATV